MDYAFAWKNLERWSKPNDDIDPRSVRKALRDIFTMEDEPSASDEELRLFSAVYAIMTRRNWKWLTISQIAYPHGSLVDGWPTNASLKSRIGLSVAAYRDTKPPLEVIEAMQVRRWFLDLVSMCVPASERDRYPHILNLVDSHAVNTDRPPSLRSSGVDCGAWCLANYFSHGMQMERSTAAVAHPVKPEMTIEEVRAAHEKAIEKIRDAIDTHPWRFRIQDAPASQDSLFSRILVHAAVNRHCLETWAYEKRLIEVTPILQQIFDEVGQVVKGSLDAAVSDASTNGYVDYPTLARRTLPRSFASRNRALTNGVIERIGNQVDIVLASAYDDMFENEDQLNEFLVLNPDRARALLWIIFTWYYQNEKNEENKAMILNEDPRINKRKRPVISTRSKVITASQDISTLRRMVMTSVFSKQWERPDPDRLAMHARFNSDVRRLARSSLERSFKGASLAQLDAFAWGLDRRRFIELMKQAAVGTVMNTVAT
ncbi:hypothetical protein AWB73_05367 [Caballeronia turbans]|nr:hypothetical protein AWB73_05367 [Caballeronia turbans]